jgi:hypothetical protein
MGRRSGRPVRVSQLKCSQPVEAGRLPGKRDRFRRQGRPRTSFRQFTDFSGLFKGFRLLSSGVFEAAATRRFAELTPLNFRGSPIAQGRGQTAGLMSCCSIFFSITSSANEVANGITAGNFTTNCINTNLRFWPIRHRQSRSSRAALTTSIIRRTSLCISGGTTSSAIGGVFSFPNETVLTESAIRCPQ